MCAKGSTLKPLRCHISEVAETESAAVHKRKRNESGAWLERRKAVSQRDRKTMAMQMCASL